jgi:nicotinate phosphoribosyltransferase
VKPPSGLFTDLYELTMLQAYWSEGMVDEEAAFSLFVRRLPPQRNHLLACGVDDALDALEHFRFDEPDLAYLDTLPQFRSAFLDWLRDFRFDCDVLAVAEGTPVFGDEPILEVEGRLGAAQVVETLVMNRVHLGTLLASKAARVVAAAAGRPVVDFGMRRMHGYDAALAGAHAFHVAGVAATSNVLAGRELGLEVSGTMAHSWVQAHDSERAAFEAFAGLYPDTVLLVDTWDTVGGVAEVIELARHQGQAFRVRAVRLDSGDLLELSRTARRMLDDAGLTGVRILASGGLDELAIAELVREGAPIDAFGVGTSMGVSADAPSLEIAYKLTEFRGRGRIKLSPGKRLLPGRKQVFRSEYDGRATGDVIGARDEALPGRPLLRHAMRGGRRLAEARSTLDQARGRAAHELARMPPRIRALEPARPPYPVEPSAALTAALHRTMRGHTG